MRKYIVEVKENYTGRTQSQHEIYAANESDAKRKWIDMNPWYRTILVGKPTLSAYAT